MLISTCALAHGRDPGLDYDAPAAQAAPRAPHWLDLTDEERAAIVVDTGLDERSVQLALQRRQGVRADIRERVLDAAQRVVARRGAEAPVLTREQAIAACSKASGLNVDDVEAILSRTNTARMPGSPFDRVLVEARQHHVLADSPTLCVAGEMPAADMDEQVSRG